MSNWVIGFFLMLMDFSIIRAYFLKKQESSDNKILEIREGYKGKVTNIHNAHANLFIIVSLEGGLEIKRLVCTMKIVKILQVGDTIIKFPNDVYGELFHCNKFENTFLLKY